MKDNQNYNQAIRNIATLASFTFFIGGSVAVIWLDRYAPDPQTFGSIAAQLTLAIVVGLAAFLATAFLCGLVYSRLDK